MTNRTVESSQQFHARLDLLKDADRKHARVPVGVSVGSSTSSIADYWETATNTKRKQCCG